MDSDQEDLTLIDSSISSLADIALHPRLKTLNVHCNYIHRIVYLDRLTRLLHLDLSANQIQQMEGMESLVSLRTLNLASNVIQTVSGLQNLRNLVKVNLAYNQIQDVSGFSSMWGPDYRLSQVDLQGNQLTSKEHLLQSFRGCVNLRHLTLAYSGSDNPLCANSDYPGCVWDALSWLRVLDGRDGAGHPAPTDEILSDIPGLEQFMDYLLSSESSDVDPISMATPRIDAALDKFKQKVVTSPDISSATDPGSSLNKSSSSTRGRHTISTGPTDFGPGTANMKHSMATHDSRLEKLEQQLAELLHVTKESLDHSKKSATTSKAAVTSGGHSSNKTRGDAREDSESESSPCYHGSRSTDSSKRPTISRLPKKTTLKKVNTCSGAGRSPKSGEPRDKHHLGKAKSGIEATRVVNKWADPSVMAADEQRREDIESTYLSMMKELETERERRWKAEQAAKKLVQHIQQLQTKSQEDQDVQQVALQATSRLKQALTNEREAKLKMQAELELSKEQTEEVTRKLVETQDREQELRRSLNSLEESAAKMEAEKLRQLAHETKNAQEADMRAAGSRRECEMLNHSVNGLREQVHQLQELLAGREQEHRKEMERRVSLESPKLQEIINRERSKQESHHTQQLQLQHQQLDQLTRQYSELEDEFRAALQIEAARYNELQNAYEKISTESAENKQAVMAAQRKDEKSSNVITELTAMVKEQKGRISELSKSKHEQTSQYKERVDVLEAHVEEARKRMVQLELLKKEKTKLQSQVQAQESVMEGLKSERKLWGQELAQQGASLAQDRGRLEAKIESFSMEVVSLKKQLEREADAVRIKTKIIEDQTETIRKLKDGLIEREEELKRARDDTLRVQGELEQQLSTEGAVNQDLQEKLDRASERKEELKQQIVDLEEELKESKKAQGILNNKWKEKTGLIGTLEKQVMSMKGTWEGKEKQLTEERDKAIHAASLAVEKLRLMDDSFRKQLEAKETNHQVELRKVAQEKQSEINGAMRKVAEVEEEMRLLLQETQANKRSMEDRVKQLNQALGQLQQDLVH